MGTKTKMILISMMIAGMIVIPEITEAGAFGKRDRYCSKDSEYRHKGYSHQERFDNMAEELGLSQQQQEQLRQQKEGHRLKRLKRREALQDVHQRLKEELSRENIDRDRLNSIAGEMKQLQSQMIDDRIDGILQMREILTPEQYQTFREKAQKMHRRMKGKMHGEKGGDR